MRSIVRLTLTIAAVGALFALAGAACCDTMLFDGFEPGINASVWSLGPGDWGGAQGHEELKGADNHIRTPGINSAREWINYRVTYNCMHAFSTALDGDVYLKAWIFEDNDVAYVGWWTENWPNAYITLMDAGTGMDLFRVGVMGEYGRVDRLDKYFYNCAVETTTDGHKALDGQLGMPRVPRRQGWRKYAILVHPITPPSGAPGDVQFFIDDKLVFNGRRTALTVPPAPLAAVPVDTIVLGSKWWTVETYWYDHVDFGDIMEPVECDTIAEAMARPDDTWVVLAPKVVSGCFTRAPFPGYFAVEESDRSAGLWVSSSYEANVAGPTEEAESVSVRGIMRTNEAGMRYLDAIEVTRNLLVAPQPRILGCSIRDLDTPITDGMLIKVWGKVTGRGQERTGDWRRFIYVDDGSGNAPVKCYYDNIISGVDPVPNVKNGDYVSVVGVAGREVLLLNPPGSPEKSIWIRKAGDLAILKAAP